MTDSWPTLPQASGAICLAVAIAILVVGALLAYIVLSLAKRWGWFARALASQRLDFRPAIVQLAAARRGRVLSGMSDELPRLVFYDQATVVVEVTRCERPPRYFVGVRLVWPDAALRLELLPRSFSRGLRKLLGVQRFSAGDREFDRRWAVLTSDSSKARQFLSPDVRQWLLALAQPAGLGETYLRIAAGELLVRQQYIHTVEPTANQPKTAFTLADARALDDLVRAAQGIYSAALRQPLAGISFTDEVEPDAEAPNCLVCGEAIIGSEVMCQYCRTPHHRECWNYVGGCSLFGCGGKLCEAYSAPTM